MSFLDSLFGSPSAPQTPTETTTKSSGLPDYSLPYYQGVLQQGAALTNTNQNPYQPYAGQQTAGLSGLQQQAIGSLGSMQVPNQTGAATGMAQDVFGRSQQPQYSAPQFNQMGLGSINVGTGSFTDPGQAAAYMNPYFQNVVDFQSQEAARQSAIQGQGLDAQAVQAGAFGGSRAALQQSERLRNLATQQGGIAATGAQNAYQAAQQAYQTDQARQLQAQQANQAAGLQAQGQGLTQNLAGNQQALANAQNQAQFGLQGLNAGLGAAYTMGNLGQQQTGQQLGITQAQLGAGGTDQATQQAALSAQYQNYLNSLNYPYQQLQFMNQLIQGGGGSAAQQQLFQAPPNVISQLGGAGLSALALQKLIG